MNGSCFKYITPLFLIALFALALSPKQVLHDIVSKHKHTAVPHHDEDRISKTSHICDVENTVATAAFNCVDDFLLESSSEKFFIRYERLSSVTYNLSFSYPQLRGPPTGPSFT